MNWITREQVKAAATTTEGALDISIEHHQQNYDAKEEELKTQNGKALSAHLCGLCVYYQKGNMGVTFLNPNTECGECPLRDGSDSCYSTGSLYHKSLQAYQAGPFDHAQFRSAELKLLNKLKQIRGDKKIDEQEIRTRIDEVGVCLGKIKDEEQSLRQELAEAEVTYSIGDRFERLSQKYLLAKDLCKIVLIRLCDGQAWNQPVKVKDFHKITTEEMKQIFSLGRFVRYWDARKKVHCG